MSNSIKKILPTVDKKLIGSLIWILSIVALVSSSQYFFFLFEGEKNSISFLVITLSKLIYFFYFVPIALLLNVLNSRLHFTQAKIITSVFVHLILMTASFLLHQSITYFFDKLLLGKNYSPTYVDSLFDNPLAWIDIVAYLLLLTAIVLLEFRKNRYEAELKSAELEHLLTESRLNELRNKIHPRFLFNTLFSIKTILIKGRNKEANKVLTMLSDFLRVTVYSNEKEETELEKEILFLELYFEIEKVSLSNSTFRLSIEEETKNLFIPTALLQPIAESVVYEVNKESKSEFSFCIETKNIENVLLIEMKVNFGTAINNLKDVVENLTAVKLAKERLAQLYSNNSSINVLTIENKNLVISILVPVIENND